MRRQRMGAKYSRGTMTWATRTPTVPSRSTQAGSWAAHQARGVGLAWLSNMWLTAGGREGTVRAWRSTSGELYLRWAPPQESSTSGELYLRRALPQVSSTSGVWCCGFAPSGFDPIGLFRGSLGTRRAGQFWSLKNNNINFSNSIKLVFNLHILGDPDYERIIMYCWCNDYRSWADALVSNAQTEDKMMLTWYMMIYNDIWYMI